MCGVRCEATSGLMTRFKSRDKVTNWGQNIAERSCHRKACVAVARKLAVIMHAMWSDGTFYVGDAAASQVDVAQRARMARPVSFWVRIDERGDDSSNAWRPYDDGRHLTQGIRPGG